MFKALQQLYNTVERVSVFNDSSMQEGLSFTDKNEEGSSSSMEP